MQTHIDGPFQIKHSSLTVLLASFVTNLLLIIANQFAYKQAHGEVIRMQFGLPVISLALSPTGECAQSQSALVRFWNPNEGAPHKCHGRLRGERARKKRDSSDYWVHVEKHSWGHWRDATCDPLLICLWGKWLQGGDATGSAHLSVSAISIWRANWHCARCALFIAAMVVVTIAVIIACNWIMIQSARGISH